MKHYVKVIGGIPGIGVWKGIQFEVKLSYAIKRVLWQIGLLIVLNFRHFFDSLHVLPKFSLREEASNNTSPEIYISLYLLKSAECSYRCLRTRGGHHILVVSYCASSKSLPRLLKTRRYRHVFRSHCKQNGSCSCSRHYCFEQSRILLRFVLIGFQS